MEFKGEYKYSDDFKVEYCNGILGNVTGMGKDIIINFYFEKPQYPVHFKLEQVDDDGNLNETYEGIENNIVREVFSGIVLNVDAAKSLRDWLDSNIKYAEDLKNK